MMVKTLPDISQIISIIFANDFLSALADSMPQFPFVVILKFQSFLDLGPPPSVSFILNLQLPSMVAHVGCQWTIKLKLALGGGSGPINEAGIQLSCNNRLFSGLSQLKMA